MNIIAYINPQLFADEGAAAAPAGGGSETGTAAESGTEAQTVNVGDTLSDGSQVEDPQVAAAMNKRLKQHPELRDAFFGQRAEAQEPVMEQPQAEPTPEEWAEAKKKFAKFYGEDVGNAVKDRFKNQADANEQLRKLQPMLSKMMEKIGVDSYDELTELVMDDDSLYEEEAEEMGMPVEAYKNYKKLQEEHDAAVAKEKQMQEQMFFRNHIAKLAQQGEEFKRTFPNFDFNAEMHNDTFRRLTSPDVGISVADAYFAVHRNELTPQLLSYGMNKAKEQMGQTIQAQKARPAEGAMSGRNPTAAEPRINPKNLSRAEMKKYKELIRMDKFTSFDR